MIDLLSYHKIIAYPVSFSKVSVLVFRFKFVTKISLKLQDSVIGRQDILFERVSWGFINES